MFMLLMVEALLTMIPSFQLDLDLVGAPMVIPTMDMVMGIHTMDTVTDTVILTTTGIAPGDILTIIRETIGVDIMMDITMVTGMDIMDIHMIIIQVIHIMAEEIWPHQVDTVPPIAT
jgi:hypothetical protein